MRCTPLHSRSPPSRASLGIPTVDLFDEGFETTLQLAMHSIDAIWLEVLVGFFRVGVTVNVCCKCQNLDGSTWDFEAA